MLGEIVPGEDAQNTQRPLYLSQYLSACLITKPKLLQNIQNENTIFLPSDLRGLLCSGLESCKCVIPSLEITFHTVEFGCKAT